MAGKYFEEFRVGEVFKHQPSRTVTETDNLLFTTLTMNVQPLHLDAEFSKNTEFGQRLVNSIFTLGLVVGLSVGELTLGTTVGNLGFEKTEFPKPVFIGDTITAETEVIEVRESKSRPQWGIVQFEHRGVNQRGEIVVKSRRIAAIPEPSSHACGRLVSSQMWWCPSVRIMAAPACRVRPAQWREACRAVPGRAGGVAGAGPPARSASTGPYPAGLGPSKGVA